MSEGEIPGGLPNKTDHLAEIAARLIESDMLTGRGWRVALVLTYVVDSSAAQASEDGRDIHGMQFAEDILTDVVNLLLYGHVHELPSEDDIEAQAKQFTEMLDQAEELRKQKNAEETEED